MVCVADTIFKLNEERLYQRLRINEYRENDLYVKRRISDLVQIAEKDTELKAYYYIDNNMKTGIQMVDQCQNKVICLCYISQKILNVMVKMTEKEEYLEAYLLNEILNEVLFCACDQMNEEIFIKMKKKGMFLTRQIAPGDNGISLKMQKTLYDLFPKELDYGVKINESCVLIPEKTLLYAFGADKNNPEICVKHDCKYCKNKECNFKVDTKI